MAALPRKWVSDGAPTLPWIRGSAIRNLGGSILCLARPLLAAPFGPSAMCFLRTSQCFGWHDPFFSREAASAYQ